MDADKRNHDVSEEAEALITKGNTVREENGMQYLCVRRHFKTMAEARRDQEAFSHDPDPDFSEFCNDIFGDG